MKYYTDESMQTIIKELQSKLLELKEDSVISFRVINPDIVSSTYAGNIVTIEGKDYLYRGYKAWVDLAQLLFCKMLTPIVVTESIIELHFVKLNYNTSFHQSTLEDKREKYGVESHFSSIVKSEEPAFMMAYLKALEAVKVSTRKRVLNLGINRGDEFEAIEKMMEPSCFTQIDFTGIDHSKSAIDFAKKRFPNENMHFFDHDINHIDELNLEKFDLIVSIGTLQSPSINFKPFFGSLVQNYLNRDGAIILGFPNCRWIDGEMVYGAKAPNYSYSEMSIVIKDIYYCKKYLQQHKFRVTITGKDYLFLTATSIR